MAKPSTLGIRYGHKMNLSRGILWAGLEVGIFEGLEPLPSLLPQAPRIELRTEWSEEINAAYEHWNRLVLSLSGAPRCPLKFWIWIQNLVLSWRGAKVL